MKKLVAVLVALGLVTALLAACGGSPSSGSGTTTTPGSGTTTTNPGSGASTVVHLISPPAFSPASVTISKGSSINLVNDVTLAHILQNGAWTNGTYKVVTEPSAPLVDKLRFVAAGDSHMVGPFNTAGTYHIFCNVHAGMNLVVIVQ